jgi:vitamin K-dependent gamma-carboxylase
VSMSQQLSGSAPERAREPAGKGGPGSLFGRLFAPVDVASLVFFRVAFGAIMLWEVYRHLAFGWVRFYYIEPEFKFTYYGFGWVQLWFGEWLYLHFLALGLLAFFIAVGFMYRLSMALFFVGFTYVFLLDQTLYLNHFYLVCLVSFLMIFIPAHRALSVDAWLRPRLRSEKVPAWALALLVAQIGIVYFYGGLAKLNGDWLRGEPMRLWLFERQDLPLAGRFFTEEWAVYFFSYGGLLLDLLVVPFLLWRRTRLAAFGFVLFFHLTNWQLFDIGIFPWFMIAATLLFFSPSWPRALGRLRLAELPSLGAWRRVLNGPRNGAAATGGLRPGQYAIPLRHFLYPGNVSWTEEGHNFSWHMKLRDKDAVVRFVAVDPASGERWRIDAQGEYGLTEDQVFEMAAEPDMILQFAHHVSEDLERRGFGDVEVRAVGEASLNGRDYQPLVDPAADLSEKPRNMAPADWILPLEEPFVFRDYEAEAVE